MIKNSAIISDILPALPVVPVPRMPHAPRPLHVPVRRPVDGIVRIPRRPSAHRAAVRRGVRQLAVAARRLHLLESIASTSRKRKRGSIFASRMMYSGIAAVVVAVTMYVSIDTWLTNRSVTGSTAHAASAESAKDATQTAVDGGTRPDETPLPKNSLANYKVAAPNPRAIYISSIHLSARILPMSVGKDGALQAPGNIYDTGWYTGSVRPGETGAMLIDAHSSGGAVGAAFDNLHKVKAGDTITIEAGSGQKYNYTVAATEVAHKESIDMQKALLPYGNAQQGLNLITCTGGFTKDYTTMKDRLVVYAVLAS